jgi:hypothetical protein
MIGTTGTSMQSANAAGNAGAAWTALILTAVGWTRSPAVRTSERPASAQTISRSGNVVNTQVDGDSQNTQEKIILEAKQSGWLACEEIPVRDGFIPHRILADYELAVVFSRSPRSRILGDQRRSDDAERPNQPLLTRSGVPADTKGKLAVESSFTSVFHFQIWYIAG